MSSAIPFSFCSFFFNAPATTEIYTLSLHDALPIHPPGLKSVQPMGAAPAVSASKSSHNASPLQPEVMPLPAVPAMPAEPAAPALPPTVVAPALPPAPELAAPVPAELDVPEVPAEL